MPESDVRAAGPSLPAYRQSAEDVAASLQVDIAYGLSADEARARLERDGLNVLEQEAPTPLWRRFLAQFQDVLVILLIAATAISAGLWVFERDAALPYEAIAIAAVVLLNAVMGFVQETRAESAVAALRDMSAAHAHVWRDGRPLRVPSTDVVPGDILIVEAGDTVPADARVIEAAALQTGEAALTGESVPVSKHAHRIDADTDLADRANMIYGGTIVTYGHGRAIVVETGMRSEMGRIAGMLARVPIETTPLQEELNQVGRTLGAVVLVIAIVMIATIILVEDVRGLRPLLDVLIVGVALAVAAVPEGLPAVITAVLSIGVQRMARRHAIVRHLRAVETLGSASVIASDKTGTLTKNEMTVREVVTASGRVMLSGTGYTPEGEIAGVDGEPVGGALRMEVERALTIGRCANNAVLQQREGRWIVDGDPTEGALIVAAAKAGLDRAALERRLSRIDEVPFSSERKLMTTIHIDAASPDRLLIFSKGAPDVLLSRCTRELRADEPIPLTEDRRREILHANDALAGRALRTLGVAFRALPRRDHAEPFDDRVERELVFAGLVGMIDPPRAEAKEAVRRARRAGIRPIMITGDHPATAAVIAAELGIAPEPQAVTGTELDAMDDAVFARTVRQAPVYARVDPAHKLRIVRSLQADGAVVGMTGDGVNDAPALKTADIGIAMGRTGTDVSRRAADMILADDNFATIVAAVEEGRAIFSNIRKFLRYLLSSNIGEVMTMLFGVLFAHALGLRPGGSGLILPLLATQILWINLVTDGAPALALGLDPPDPALMQLRPRSRHDRVVTPQMWRGIFFVGAVMAASTLFVLDLSLPGGLVPGSGSLVYAQTMAFTTLMMGQLFNVVNARSDERSALRGLFRNGWLWAALGSSIVLHGAVVYIPVLQRAFTTTSLDLRDWLICAAAASVVLWCRELSKLSGRLTHPLRP